MSTNWETASSLAMGAGVLVLVLVLAVATFASVHSSNRSARIAERAMMPNLLPVLMNSRLDDLTRLDFLAHEPADGTLGWFASTSRHRNLDRENPR